MSTPRRNSWIRPAAEGLGVAAAYFIVGKLALLLAIPPGYATAVWPSAGIALAGILFFGTRVWPGVLLGSFLVNVGTTYDPTTLSTHLKSLGLALSIGLGAALQALLGAALARRFFVWPRAFTREREVLSFVIGVAPISCFVNATVAVTSLFAWGRISESGYFFSWWTWWVGDTIGVILFTPLLLLWASKGARRRRIGLVAPTLGIVFALVVLLFMAASRAEKQRVHLEFGGKVDRFASIVEKDLENHLNVLRSIAYHFDANPAIDRASFRAFVSPWLTRFPGLQGYSWNPRVTAVERGAFEDRARREGFADFGIKEFDAEGKLFPAREREEYVPVLYIEPLKGNEKALGCDVSSDPARREALVRARDEGRPATTGGVVLVQGKASSDIGALLFVPVYRRGVPVPDVEARRRNIEGYVTGVLRLRTLLGGTLDALHKQQLRLRILDKSEPRGERIIFESKAGDGRAEFTKEVERGTSGRLWKLQFPLTEEYLAAHRSWAAWSILAAGMLFTGLLGTLLLILMGRAEAVQALVAERTEELETFTYTIAHDLRGPLRAIHRFSDLLLEDFAGKTLEPEGVDYLKRTAEAAARMDRMIQDLLNFSRVARGAIKIQPVALTPIVQDLERSFESELKDTKARLTVDSELPRVLGDSVLLAQALTNLVANGLKFVPPGALPVVEIHAERRDGFVRVTVLDHGIGIAPEYHAKLFRIFERLSTEYAGTGVGLAIVKKAVERMNGRFGLESAVGRGSAFWIELPEAPP